MEKTTLTFVKDKFDNIVNEVRETILSYLEKHPSVFLDEVVCHDGIEMLSQNRTFNEIEDFEPMISYEYDYEIINVIGLTKDNDVDSGGVNIWYVSEDGEVYNYSLFGIAPQDYIKLLEVCLRAKDYVIPEV